MVLFLQSGFSESGDTLPGFKLCQHLINHGYHVNVTTTSSGARLQSEKTIAKDLTAKSKGSVNLLEPNYLKNECPSTGWIANQHKHYFGYLSELKDVDTIIGTIPGTLQTAVDLKKTLKCKLVLLPTIKIKAEQEDLKKEINSLAEYADEIWSLGADTYCYYQNIFQEVDGTASSKHSDILLQPFFDRTDLVYHWNRSYSRFRRGNKDIKKIVSIWTKPYIFFNRGRETYSGGSNIQNFQTLAPAVGYINGNAVKRHLGTIHWYVHGLKFQDPTIKSIEEKAKPNVLKITALKEVTSTEDLSWKNCLAYIDPNIEDESFNFNALNAYWLGIPTIVSSQSSVGKILLCLSCPRKHSAVITLTGNPDLDKGIWIDKIYKELINEDARPIQWAREISEYLHSNSYLWKLDLSLLSRSSMPDDFYTAQDVAAACGSINAKIPERDKTMVKTTHAYKRQSEPEQSKHQVSCFIPLPKKKCIYASHLFSRHMTNLFFFHFFLFA